MDKLLATFEVLYLLAVIDLELNDNEVDVVNSYINQNQGKGNYDPQAVMRTLNILSWDGRLQELVSATRFLNSVCSAQDKNSILGFARQVVIADRRLSDYEISAFRCIGNIWNIDINRFIV